MALSRLWRRWFGAVDYEHELPRLADQIAAAQLALVRAQATRRRWPALFLMQAAVVYTCYALFIGLSTTRKRRSTHQATLLLAPFLCWAVFRALRRATGALVARRQRALKALTDRRKTLVAEYKKKTNYDKIRELIAEPEPPAAPKPGGAAKRGARSTKSEPASAHSSAVVRAAHAPDKHAVRDRGVAAAAAARARPGTGARGSGSVPQGGSADASDAAAAQLASASDFGAAPVRSRTWLDRLFDVVLGENELSPANRDALICPRCFNHNGLAPFGKSADEITYRCPACGLLNLSAAAKAEAAESEVSTDQEAASRAGSEPGPALAGDSELSKASANMKWRSASMDAASAEGSDLAATAAAARKGAAASSTRTETTPGLATPQDAADHAAAGLSESSEPSAPRGPGAARDDDVDSPRPDSSRSSFASASREASPASTGGAKSVSQRPESPDYGPGTTEQRIMREIDAIHREAAEARTAQRASSAAGTASSSRHSSSDA